MSKRTAVPAVVSVRTAVAQALDDLPRGTVVVAACSGGPDSLALVGAAAWVAHRGGIDLHAVVIDHALQPGSAAVAADAADAARALGAADARVVAVDASGPGGPEAAARRARYAALEQAAVEASAAAILLGHTREDQAETVLLRLARGSGARSLAAMRAVSGPYRRPFLHLPRAQVRSAADALLAPLGRQAWADPHNEDPAFARVRVRALVEGLEAALGPGAVLGLARSADLLRDDADALDVLATSAMAGIVSSEAGSVCASCDALAALPRAVRTRVLRLMALRAGALADDLGSGHVGSLEALVSDWRGQGEVRLPGRVVGTRGYGRLCLVRS
ncbi:MAG: tRNA lysidine(34) synthetase TilS [Candidatus Nanopelagicales bacterium]